MGILPAETLASVRTALARYVNALEFTGTATTDASSSSTRLVCTKLVYTSTDALKGYQIALRGGAGAGDDRIISAFTPSSDLVEVVPAFSATPTTATTFDIYRTQVADKDLLNLALKHAIENAQEWHLIDWEDVASIVLGSITPNGGFEDWSDGTSSAPDGWTLQEGATPGAAIAREGTIILPPFRYSAKLTNEASQYAALQSQNASLVYSWKDLASQTVSVSAWVYADTATRVRLQLTDGVTTWNSSYHSGNSTWEKLTITDKAFDATHTEATVQLRIETGTAISAYVHDFRFVISGNVYEYRIPKKFLRIKELTREIGTDFQWETPIPYRLWSLDRSRERLWFNSGLWTPPGEYRVKVVGQAYQSAPSADTDAIDLPIPYLLEAGRAFILARNKPGSAEARQAELNALRLRRSLHRQPYSGSVRVR